MKGLLKRLSLSLKSASHLKSGLAMLMTLKQRPGSLLVYSFFIEACKPSSQSRDDHPPG